MRASRPPPKMKTGQVRQLKAAGCEKVFREKITGTTADRPQLRALMKKLAPGDVVITPAVDRLSRDTTDLLVIARDMQRAGAGIRSRPNRSSIPRPTSPRSSSPSLALRRSSNAAAFSNAPRAAGPTPRKRASNSAASPPSPRTSRKRPASASMPVRRSAALPAATMSVRARFRDFEQMSEEPLFYHDATSVMPSKSSLSRLSRQEPTNDELKEILDNINGLPDRMVGILLSALVESRLERLIIGNLPIKDRDTVTALVERGGALSTFAGKIDLSHAMALIFPAVRNNLHCIRRIRNAFAHAPRPITFETGEISQECMKLRSLKTGRILSAKVPGRVRFIFACNDISIFLLEETIADENSARPAALAPEH